jgi:ribosomal protein S18 acetylase RimI-like enzyme
MTAIRPATVDDDRAIKALLEACGQNWTLDHVRSELARQTGRHLVLEDGRGAILGWITEDVAEIDMLAVHPLAQRTGLGRQLLEAWEADVRSCGARKVWLDVRPSNTAALRVYERAGYCAKGRRPRYYHDGEDALLLERDL